jgi:hypothetical protein
MPITFKAALHLTEWLASGFVLYRIALFPINAVYVRWIKR